MGAGSLTSYAHDNPALGKGKHHRRRELRGADGVQVRASRRIITLSLPKTSVGTVVSIQYAAYDFSSINFEPSNSLICRFRAARRSLLW
jgi:hypothetical protein